MQSRFFIFSIAAAIVVLVGCAGMVNKDAQSSREYRPAHEVESTPSDGTEVRLSPEDDLPAVFRKLSENPTVSKIVFEPGLYSVNAALSLPRNGSLVIIEGSGATIKVGRGVDLFKSIPKDQSQAMDWNKTRYLIQNFGRIEGGDKGVYIGSSFNTVLRNIHFIGQEKAAVDLVFCLMSTIEEVLVTNVAHDGIVLRTAVDAETNANLWPGTSFNNSQCNHSLLRNCRVYNKKGCTGTSFKVLQSTGVKLQNCISEGWPNKRAVFFDGSRATTAKLFMIDNFHLEHLPEDGALCFKSSGSTIVVDGLFLQHGEKSAPAIWLMTNGNYVFRNIPYWPERAWVKSSHSPFVVIEQCAPRFSNIKNAWVNEERKGEPIYPHYFNIEHTLVR